MSDKKLTKNQIEIIKFILDKHILRLTPFEPITYTKGDIGPFYMDIRLLYSYPIVRRMIIKEFMEKLKINTLEFDTVAGVATGAIGWAALIAAEIDYPMIYIRKENKKYGSNKLVEGVLKENQKVLVIEDVIFTGNSCIEACANIQALGAETVACFSILNCDTKVSKKAFNKQNTLFYSLLDATDFANIAFQTNYLNKMEYDVTMDWIANPEGWSPDRLNKL
ncbi:MAG TPA: orotate phosphoribosyltransferase [Victivallales bacterium]|nr:orotate phosphoribosyltransferase [Victivallales bacterium]